jgi:hypothetical protein
VNEKGPFTFAIDSGAGTSIVQQRVVSEAHLLPRPAARTLLGGLSTSPIASKVEATITSLALGRLNNNSRGPLVVAVTSNLPDGIDGILDPLELSPSGYSIDLPNRQLIIFESGQLRLSQAAKPPGGAIVPWIRKRGDPRPFVKLGNGRVALIDTGSNFGLAITEPIGRRNDSPGKTVHDLGGGAVQARRVTPTTISVGDLELKNIPTDVLTGVAPGTPLILGREALAPFRITFDPVAGLIEIVPVS